MAKTAQKSLDSTQKFTEIVDIREDVVLFTGQNASLVIEVRAVNFALLSREEQNSRIYAYASLLNSLSFPIEILIRNKRVDITGYLALLQTEVQKAQTSQLSAYIEQYKNFVQELVKVNTVLDKKFFIIIPYSYLEKGAQAAATPIKKDNTSDVFFLQAKQGLRTKADTLLSQLARINLTSKILGKEELIKLFYEAYNPLEGSSQTHIAQDVTATVVRGKA